MNVRSKALAVGLAPLRRLEAGAGPGTGSLGWSRVEAGLRPAWTGGAPVPTQANPTPRNTLLLLVGILLLALPCAAQVEIGDTAMNLSGDIGFNYSGTINQGSSTHNLGLSGDASLTGSYYNPNFLNFAVRPYYNRSQSNSVFGAVTDTSGVTSSVNLFSGSHFPGSLSYSRMTNSTGEYGVQGSGIGLATNGNSQGFAISWSALLPDLPTLTASYAISDGSDSIYGTHQESKQTQRDLILLSTYKVAGYRLSGEFSHRNIDGTFSEVLEGVDTPVKSDSATNNFQVNASHPFPMQGSYSVAFSRTSYDSSFHDGSSGTSSGASDTLNGNLNFRPTTKLSVGSSASYSDSLLGSIPEPVLNGGTEKFRDLGSFRSFQMEADANYQLLHNLFIKGSINHIEERFLDQSFSATQYGGSAYYFVNHDLLKGLSFNITAFDTATKQGNVGMGFAGNINFNRKVHAWDVDANFSYSQNVQTLVVVDTTSSYGWVTNVRRHVGTSSYFTAGYSASRSGFNTASDSTSSAMRVSSGFSYRRYSMNTFYSKSHGTAAFTPTGLVALPENLPPSSLPLGSALVFDSKAYGINGSASPIRHLNVSAGYAQSKGDTIDPLTSVFTKNNLLNGVLQYKLRKIYVNGGYTHLRQSVGTPGTAPVTVTTYYIGISRWFNFF